LKYNKLFQFGFILWGIAGSLLSGCDAGDVKALFTLRMSTEKLDKICEARGGLSSPGPLEVDGYYLPGASAAFGYEEMRLKLGGARFQFFEMDTAWVEKSGTWGEYRPARIKGNGRYTRFYIAERGNPDCSVYEKFLDETSDKAENKLYLRLYGIYPKHCIAAVKTDELKSRYGIINKIQQDPEIKEVTWDIDEIRNLKSGEVYASYSRFQHCYKGRKDNGDCRGGSEETYSCPAVKSEKSKHFKDIFYKTFKASPNPILEKRLTVEELHDPVTIPVDTVTPELIEVIEGKENLKQIWGDNVRDLYMSKEAEGYALFEERKRAEVWDVNGVTHTSNQPQLCMISEEDRRYLKVDISIYNSRNNKFYDFNCLRAIPGDGVYFIAWGGRSELTEKANNFKILRYSWSGKLERITAGTLPFTFLARYSKGEPWNFYAKLRIDKGYYYFSILETFDSDFAVGPMQPTKEHKFRIPIK
jgi:hypothetical protein